MTRLVPPQYLKSWMLIVRCIHTRGEAQEAALVELKARGLWLNEEQKAQAGLLEETDRLLPEVNGQQSGPTES